jgi:AcrR family transcriptional regulator
MVTKREAKREALKQRLIEIAGKRIVEGGLAGLRARDVAADAGSAVGGIYTVFADLDDLILHVNARTLESLGRALAEAVGDRRGADALKALAREYFRFAREHQNLWAALWDDRVAQGRALPDWLLDRQTALLDYLVAALAAVQPGLSEETLRIRARTYYAAVHGVVTMSLQRRFLALPDDRLEPELDSFVNVVVAGTVGQRRNPTG